MVNHVQPVSCKRITNPPPHHHHHHHYQPPHHPKLTWSQTSAKWKELGFVVSQGREPLCCFYVKCWAVSQTLLGGRVLEPPGGSASICSRVALGSGASALPCSLPQVLQAQEGCCPRLQSAPWSSLPRALERVGGQ